MNARWILPVAAVVLLLAASLGRTSPATSAPRAQGSLYAFAGPPARLYSVDPQTLRLRHGRSAAVAGHVFGWSFSPDGSRLAAGSDSTAEVRFYDLRRLRALGDVALVPLSVKGLVAATAWAGPSRVVAVVVSPGCCGLGDTTVSGVDATRRRELWRRDLHGSLQSAVRYRGGFVLVVGPKYAVGSSRLVVVDGRGRTRTVSLDRIRSGWRPSGSGARFIAHQWSPGLAVDPSGRAFVVQAGAPIADVDLRRLSVRYHEPSEPISLLGRLHDWLEPKAEAKGMQGPQRFAVWLGGGLVAITGADHELSRDARGREQETDVPAGLKLVDTSTWSVRTLDHATTTVTFAHGVLYAYGTSWDSASSKSTGEGLTAYDAGGRELYHRYGDEPIYSVTPAPRGVVVAGNQSSSVFAHQDLLDARSGTVIGHVADNVQLIAGDEPFWF